MKRSRKFQKRQGPHTVQREGFVAYREHPVLGTIRLTRETRAAGFVRSVSLVPAAASVVSIHAEPAPVCDNEMLAA